MKSIVIHDDEIAKRNSNFLSELHCALSTAVVMFGKGSAAVKGRDLPNVLANAE